MKENRTPPGEIEIFSGKLSEVMMKFPKSLSSMGTKMSMVDKGVREIDDIESEKLHVVTSLYLSKN